MLDKPEEEDSKTERSTRKNPCAKCLPTRYVFAVIGAIGIGIVYGLKVNLHVAMISMVNHTYALSHGGEPDVEPTAICPSLKSPERKPIPDGPLQWSEKTQGVIYSTYFVGYLCGQYPGGRTAEVYSAKWVFFSSVATSIVGTLLMPLASKLHYGFVMTIRVLMGFAGGFSFPSMHALLAHWAPPEEICFMSTVTYAGLPLGTLIFMLTSGIIANHVSWQAVFYIHGGISSLWLVLWIEFIQDAPSHQTKYISEEEREFIASSTRHSTSHINLKRKMKVPWAAIFMSMPFYAIFVAHFCANVGFYMLLIELPKYLKTVLNFTIVEITIYTSIPYLTMWIFSMILSRTLDHLRKKDKLSTTNARKIATTLQSVGTALCFAVLCFEHCNRALGVVLMTIAVSLFGSMFSGFLCNHLDIAPNFAGTLMAITNTFGTIPAIVVPNLFGYLFHKDPSFTPWLIMFLVTIALSVLELVVYLIFGSGEVQPWNFD